MLVSCSQDNFIRVLCIAKDVDLASETGVDEIEERLKTLELTSNNSSSAQNSFATVSHDFLFLSRFVNELLCRTGNNSGFKVSDIYSSHDISAAGRNVSTLILLNFAGFVFLTLFLPTTKSLHKQPE